MRGRTMVWRAFIGVVLSLASVLFGGCGGDSGAGVPAPAWPVEDCSTEIDEDMLERLRISFEHDILFDPTAQILPGQTLQFFVGYVICCYDFVRIDGCAAWSVEPDEGARIGPASGLLTLDPWILPGKVYTVRADLQRGGKVLAKEVHVYTPEQNPLVGRWSETAQYTCLGGREVSPSHPIGSLRFRADGRFDVTWAPFEIYMDYWGTYDFDLAGGTLGLSVEMGNHVPEDLDGVGFFSIAPDGALMLSDMWLGRPSRDSGPARCGHRFVD